MRRLLLALQFLTVFPVRVSGDVPDEEVGHSAVFFPVVGAAQGALAVAAAYVFAKFIGPEAASAAVVAALALTNGGFHLDGLSDTFDALAVKSSGDRTSDIGRRLSVMKDSSAGPIGVAAIVFAVLFEFVLIKGLLTGASRPVFFCLLFLMPVYSRWAMVPPMYHGRPARKEGLGRVFVQNAVPAVVGLSTAIVSAAAVIVWAIWLRSSMGFKGLFLFFPLLAVLYLFGILSERFFRTRFGGITGDMLGAMSELSEILYLAGVTIWLQRFT